MAYENFQDLIEDLHSGVSDTVEEGKNIIEINEKRQFTPKDFDTIIAYEGDINSQVITFKSIRYSDNHDLYACKYHIIKWKNLSSGVEGKTNLTLPSTIPDGQNYFYATWEVPSDLCTQAGTIEISISFYDKKDGAVVYSWNTASYSGLSVAKSMDSVGFDFPAKDEILFIDKDTKNIVAPQGYNNIICNYGDIGVANVYFLINRYIGKKSDLDVSQAAITIYVVINGEKNEYILKPDNIKHYSPELSSRINEGLIFIDWEVPSEITAEEYGAQNLQVSLKFEHNGKTWFSNTYSGLKISPSVLEIDIDPGTTNEAEINYYIEEYLKNNVFIFDANLIDE